MAETKTVFEKPVTRPESVKTVRDYITAVVREEFLNSEYDNAYIEPMNPYTLIVMQRYATAEDKVRAMSMEPGYNRMRCGSCDRDDVVYWIWRTGRDRYTLKSIEDPEEMSDRALSGKSNKDEWCPHLRRIVRGITASEVVGCVGEHNIMQHEIIEMWSEIKNEALK